MAHNIFISHSSKDVAIASAVVAALEERKIRYWVSYRDIKPGEGWAQAITKAIEKSSVMVLIFSSNSNNSDDVLREITMAVNCGVFIIPLRVECIEPNGTMRYCLSNLHWLDAVSPLNEKKIKELVKRIEKIIGSSSSKKLPKSPIVVEPKKKEVREEVGLAIEMGLPFKTWHFTKEPFWVTGVTFLCKYVSGNVSLSSELADYVWINPDDYKEYPLSTTMEEQIKSYRDLIKNI
jgi:hypothetical protein